MMDLQRILSVLVIEDQTFLVIHHENLLSSTLIIIYLSIGK